MLLEDRSVDPSSPLSSPAYPSMRTGVVACYTSPNTVMVLPLLNVVVTDGGRENAPPDTDQDEYWVIELGWLAWGVELWWPR